MQRYLRFTFLLSDRAGGAKNLRYGEYYTKFFDIKQIISVRFVTFRAKTIYESRERQESVFFCVIFLFYEKKKQETH